MTKKKPGQKSSASSKDASLTPAFVKKKVVKPSVKKKNNQKKDGRARVKGGHVGGEKKIHIAEQLEEIYKNPDGSMPDMTSFVTKDTTRFLRAFLFLVFSLCVFVVIFWFGVVQYAPEGGFSQENIILSISGEEMVSVGDSVRYRVRYRNDQDVVLKKTKILVRFPEGFLYESASVEPEIASSTVWNLGVLQPYESGYIDVYGVMYGDQDEAHSARVFLTYTPENFSSEFQSVAKTEFTTTNPEITFSVDGDSEVVPGAETTLIVKLSGLDVGEKNHALVVDGDGVFVKKTADVESVQFDDLRWDIAKEVDEFTITIRGVFLSPDFGKDSVSLPLRYIVFDSEKGTEYTFSQTVFTASVVKQDLVLTSIVNGTTQDVVVQPGDVLRGSVLVKNNSTKTLENVRVRAVLDAPSFNNKSILHWPGLEDPLDGVVVGEQLTKTRRRGSITWDEDLVPELARIGSGETVSIDFSVPIRTADQAVLANFSESSGTMTTEIRYAEAGGFAVFSGDPLVFTINSDTSVQINHALNKESVGRSDVSWVIENSFHGLEDVRVYSEVYGDASVPSSTMIVPAGSADFNTDTRVLTWRIPSIPIVVDVLPLQFSVIRRDPNPSQTQLMSGLTFEGVDSETGKKIIILGDPISL